MYMYYTVHDRVIFFSYSQAQIEDGPDDDGNMFTRPGKVRQLAKFINTAISTCKL